jgi:hypothetical protein
MPYFTPSNLPLVVRGKSSWSILLIFRCPGRGGRKSCIFLRELYQRDKKLRVLATLARVDHSLALAGTRTLGSGALAPHRMGKSEFLEQDLIPAAQQSGLLTAYSICGMRVSIPVAP